MRQASIFVGGPAFGRRIFLSHGHPGESDVRHVSLLIYCTDIILNFPLPLLHCHPQLFKNGCNLTMNPLGVLAPGQMRDFR
jgi:hypothetical protein